MAISFSNQESDYWRRGSPDDPRLFHTGPSDRIRVLSPQVGEGYIQQIPLQEGLSLIVRDYLVHSTFVYTTARRTKPCLEFEFCLGGRAAGRASFIPHVDLQENFRIQSAYPRQLKLEVIISHSMLDAYSPTAFKSLHPLDQAILFDWVDRMYRLQRGYAAKSPQAAFNQLLSGALSRTQIPSAVDPFDHLELYSLGRLWMSITSHMQQLLHQILSGCLKSKKADGI